MTATTDPPASGRADVIELDRPLGRAEGVELLGPVHGSGLREGAALVRRADGQMVQLGRLMYGLLECADGRRGTELVPVLAERLGRRIGPEQVERLAQKLAAQGLLAGTEHNAPPRSNPLLALRWKVLVTRADLTRRLTAPFTFLFEPWVMWPMLAAFAVVFWYVLVRKGVESATAQAFHSPGLLLLVFVLAVVSAGFHELGHAAACRYGGATPGGMGMGLYLVWPAFYTDVTDAYRLPRRARLRVDLAGLYFNAVVAVLTMVVWLFWRVDALLLLVALQILQMAKQLSPIIRADGYHILSDATGVPDLYAHLGPTLRRLLPGHHRDPSALTGRARLLVTLWVLIIVPVLLSLMLGAILLLPRLATTAWDGGHRIAAVMPHQVATFQLVSLAASAMRLVALLLPVAGAALVTQKVVRTMAARGWAWSAGRPGRRAGLVLLGSGLAALLAWSWWPSGQYRPIPPGHGGTLPGLVRLIGSPASATGATDRQLHLTPGTRLALAMVPVGGPSRAHPAVFLVGATKGQPPAEIVDFGNGADAFPFTLPGAPGPGGTQALAVGTRDGGVVYSVAYALVTVSGGTPVTETNSAFALARCRQCTTAAVSFQVVLVVGSSDRVTPINAAGALNSRCPACATTAIADQIVVTLRSQPTPALLAQLQAALQQLNALPALGSAGTPQAIAAEVAGVQDQIEAALQNSDLLSQQTPPTTTTTVVSQGGSPTTVGYGGTTETTVGSTTGSTAYPTTQTTTAQTTTGQTTTPQTTTPATSPPTTSVSSPSTTMASTSDSATTAATTSP